MARLGGIARQPGHQIHFESWLNIAAILNNVAAIDFFGRKEVWLLWRAMARDNVIRQSFDLCRKRLAMKKIRRQGVSDRERVERVDPVHSERQFPEDHH